MSFELIISINYPFLALSDLMPTFATVPSSGLEGVRRKRSASLKN